jgi:hypothetical protein
VKDIPQIQIVRNSVKENTLSDPNLVTDQDCENFSLTEEKAGFVKIMTEFGIWNCRYERKASGAFCSS